MRIEKITDKEGISTLMLFLMGSTLITGIGGGANRDAWISGILGILMSIPIILIYSRIQAIFLGKDFFEILENLFGKVFGKAISLVYILYSFHLGALVMRNFGEFANTVAMPETPMFFPMLCIGLLCIIIVKLGIEEIAKFSTYLLPVLIFVLLFIQLLAFTQYHNEYLKPVLENGIRAIIPSGFSVFSFPFAESVLFLGIMFTLKTKKSPYKVYFLSILFAGIIIIILTIRNIEILGPLLSKLYFPSHVAVSRISTLDIFQRMEVSVVLVFINGVFIKCSICLFVACKGISRVLNLKDYRSIVTQIGILVIYFAYTIYPNIMEMNYWAFKVYQYYAFPMQVILPVIIWIFAEVHNKRKMSQNQKQQVTA